MDLRETRKLKNLSQRSVAQMACVSEATINEIELGKVFPSKSTRKNVEFCIGEVDWVGTRLRNLKAENGSSHVAEAILDYVHSSTEADRATKLQFLRKLIKQL